ncbi:MAG: DUF859 family phage minor structural protein [bacterium]|nr:DUF859 family phage minor structural protein [bacterium]
MNERFRANGVRIGGTNDNHAFVDFQLAHQDIAGNFSLLNWQFHAHFNRSDSQLDAGIVNTNVGQVYNNGGRIKPYQGSLSTRNHFIASGTVRVNHRDDGTEEFQIGIGLSFYGGGRSEGTSRVYNLPTIPRQSNPSFSKSLYTLGESITVVMNRKANFTHRGTIQIPDGNEIKAFENVGHSFDWTPNETEIEEIYKRMPNTLKTSLGVDITTWKGGTQIGGIGWQNVEIQLDSSKIQPDFNDFDFADSNAKITEITGNPKIFVQGFSKPKAWVLPKNKMRAKKYATPNRYIFALNGATISADYSENKEVGATFEKAVNSAGSLTISASAVDSRGVSKTVNKTAEVLPYSAPVLSVSAKRQNNFDETVEIDISGTISTLKIGNSNKNRVVSLQMRHRASGGSWENWKTIQAVLTEANFSAQRQYLSLNRAGSFEIEVKVADRLSETSSVAESSPGKPIFFISSNREKVGVNKVPEFGDLDVLGDIFSRGRKVLTDSQEATDYWEMIDMGWRVKGLFYKKNGFCGFRMRFVGTYGNGRMSEKIPEKFWPKHETPFVGVNINSGNHSGGFVLTLGTNGEITKLGTNNHQEYHCSGVYLAKNNL